MGRSSKYPRELLTEAVTALVSIAGVLRHLGVPWSGGMHAHISRRIKFFELDTSHFTGMGHRLGAIAPERLRPDQILVQRLPGSGRAKPHMLRRALTEAGVPYRCVGCGISGEWNGQPLILHVDHIDGNYLDCRFENVRFLCPNCHSQTPSWAGRNKATRRYLLPPCHGSPIRIEAALTLFDDRDDAQAS